MAEPAAGQVSEDAILGGRLRLRQPRQGYRAAIDPVLLAAAVPAGHDDRVLDVGMGVGAASLCLWARMPGCRVTGLELQPDLAHLAGANVALNDAAQAVSVVEGDLLDAPADVDGPFDAVMTNPPYLDAARFTPSPHPGKSRADTESEAGLAAWIAFCCSRARPGGHIVVIHRADRLDALLPALRASRCGAITVFPLWPKAGRPAKRVLVAARARSNAPMALTPGMVLHQEDGAFTPEAERVLRHGEALPLRHHWR